MRCNTKGNFRANDKLDKSKEDSDLLVSHPGESVTHFCKLLKIFEQFNTSSYTKLVFFFKA